MEIVREDQTISCDVKEVLHRWHNDISKLYSGLLDNPDVAFDNQFYEEILQKKTEFDKMSVDQQIAFSTRGIEGDMLNAELTLKEVSEAVDRAKLGKSYLSIPNDALKSDNAKRLLYKFFNLCFTSGINPGDWNFSNIIPIPKPDKDSRDPLQNRCISILCCVAKVYSNVLNKRIQTYLEANNILVDEQNGFRASRSCIDHIFVLITLLRNRKALGKETFAAFIDFKKAFDCVDRNLLFYKLALIGITGNMYKAISSLYANPQSRIILNGYETEYFSCPLGVKQGDCLSPTLFAIFINDLAQELKESGLGINVELHDECSLIKICTLLYADDIVCLAETELELQQLLFIIEKWCCKWKLEVNLTKTNILHVRNKRKMQSKFTFLFNRRPVPYCKSYKYLGINVDENLSFKFMVDKHSEAAGRALSSVITKMIKNGGFPLNIFSLLYNSCVTSIADYSAPVTGFEEYSSAIKIQLRAVRAYLGVPKNAANAGVLSEIGWLLPKFRGRLSMMRHYHRMINTNNDRLVKKVFLWDKKLNENSRVSTWFTEIKSIFYECDLSVLFDTGLNFDIRFTSSYMKQKYETMQANSLFNECKLLPKLRTFMMFKDFTSEPIYVRKPLDFNLRRLIARLRLGCLPLRLETGRYSIPRLPEEERVCFLCAKECDNPEVESECHFLFKCPTYFEERSKWYNAMNIPDDFEDLPTTYKLKIILDESANIKPTAIYLANSTAMRSRLLNFQ